MSFDSYGSAIGSGIPDPADPAVASALQSFFAARLPIADEPEIVGIEVADFGHSATNWVIRVRFDDGQTPAERRFVAKVQTRGGWFDSPRSREFRLLQFLRGWTAIPVATPVFVDDAGGVIGTPFLVLDWIRGTADHELLSSPGRPTAERSALFREFLDVVVAIHQIDHRRDELAFLSPGSDAERNPARAHLNRLVADVDAMSDGFAVTAPVARALDWVGGHLPTAAACTVVHGDFGPHNALTRDTRLVALLDWEFATVGDPLLDLAWFTIRGRRRRDNFRDAVCSVDDFLDAYTDRTGTSVDRDALLWWQVYAVLRNVVGRGRHECWVAKHAAAEGQPREIVRPTSEDDRVLTDLVPVGAVS